MVTISLAFLVMLFGLVIVWNTPELLNWKTRVGHTMFAVGLFWVLANINVIQAWFSGVSVVRH